MKLDRFINRPVLSTVISIVVVILGILGLVSLPVSQYPDIAPPTIRVTTTYTGANAQTILEQCYRSAGRANQRCGGHDVYEFHSDQYRRSQHRSLF